MRAARVRPSLPSWATYARWSGIQPRVWFPFVYRDYIGRPLSAGRSVSALLATYDECTAPGDLSPHERRRARQLARAILGRLRRSGFAVQQRADGRYLVIAPDGRGRVIGWGCAMSMLDVRYARMKRDKRRGAVAVILAAAGLVLVYGWAAAVTLGG